MIIKTMFGIVRKDDEGNEFLIADELTYSRDEALALMLRTKNEIPGWHKANPTQRVARFTVTEEKD